MGIPVALAAVLSIPLLGLGYFWDDILFLTGGREGGGPARFLRPEAGEAFYRPVAQGLYFLLLRAVDPANGFIGHALNLVALLTATALLVALVSDLVGRRAGMLAGLVFAASGQIPSLVAWISCSQDLFAISFTLAALWFRNRERQWPAIACIAIAILCKETAAIALPLLALWDRIAGRKTGGWTLRVLPYALLGLLWVMIHPGIHALAGHGFASGATGYVGIEHPGRWGTYFLRYLMTLSNLPPAGFARPWPDDLSAVAMIALAMLMFALIAYDGGPMRAVRADRTRATDRVAWLGVLIGAPTLLLPTILVRHWAPYFAAFPAVGVALVTGPRLAHRSKTFVIVFLSLFTLLGVWCRGIAAPEEPVWTESVLKDAARATATVRDHFRIVFPHMPPRSQVVLSVGTTGVQGIRGTLLDNQALRVWYGDSSIRAVSTLQRDPGAETELLARVTPDLDVIAIDPSSGGTRTSGAKPDWYLVGRTLRNYAREVVADGDVEGGIRIMDILSKIEPPEIRSYNRRLVAMMLLAGGRRSDAHALLAVMPGFEPVDARKFVERLLAEASSSESLDAAAFEAFGLRADDPATLRWIVQEMRREKSTGQAAWWAARLARVAPGDPEAAAILKETAAAGIAPNRVAEWGVGGASHAESERSRSRARVLAPHGNQ
jgi:hypothetical protein